MAELSQRDAALLLDMLLAARDARSFIASVDEAAFLESRLHQNAVIRSLEVIGEAASKVIDKNIEALTRIADRHVVIERGRVVWTGVSADLKAAPEIQHRYLGV